MPNAPEVVSVTLSVFVGWVGGFLLGHVVGWWHRGLTTREDGWTKRGPAQ
jgi:hypothetical protein